MSIYSYINRFFPAPTYMQLPGAGVDISDSSLKYIKFKTTYNKESPLELEYWGDIDIPDGVLQRGAVNDPEKLTAVIREVRKRTGVKYVRVSLPEEHAYIFETEIRKDTKFKEIRGQLEFKMQEEVPLSPADAFFDYDISESGRDTSMLNLTVTAYARDTVMSYYDACIKAGVRPLSFEVEAQAITRAAILTGNVHTHLIVDFGHTRTGIGIVHDGVLMYTSTIDIGGRDLSQALRSTLGDKTEDELTEIKNKKGLVPGTEDTIVYDTLKPVIDSIIKELNQRIQYWNNKEDNLNDRQIESVILCGGSINMRGLLSYFKSELKLEVKQAEVWQNAFSLEEIVPPIDRQHSYGYATAIGLALSFFSEK